MPDETQRRYLFVAIDRATRWGHMGIYADQTENSSADFLNKGNRPTAPPSQRNDTCYA
jgi:hypothetical protein